MGLSYDILLKVVGGLVGVYLLLSLFNVSGLTRIRAIASLPVSIILLPDGKQIKLRGIFDKQELINILQKLSVS